MKLLVDEMPSWSGDCPFTEEKWEDHVWVYMCKLTNEYCNLNEVENECQMFKKLG